MKTRTKALLLSLCAVLLVTVSVLGTVAYLTSTQTVTNTFTVGDVEIVLDEKDTDDSKEDTTTNGRDKANKYHLLPSTEYEKDPTVTVKADSEDAYVRIIMTVHNADAVQAIIDADDTKDDQGNIDKGTVEDYSDLFTGWNDQIWEYQDYTVGSDTISFEFRYKDIVTKNETKDTKLAALFEKIIVPEYVTDEQLEALYGNAEDEEGDFKIEVEAHAIQATGFNNADAAWIAFDGQ